MHQIVRRVLIPVAILTGTLLQCWAQTPLEVRPFVHPGIYQNHQDLEFMKRKVAAGEQPWMQAWENLRGKSYSALDFRPVPFAHIVRGSYGRGSTGDRALSDSANAAYSHALQWYITGDRAHARKAIEILNAWSPILWDFEGNDAKLLAGWTGGAFANAAEILRSSDSSWQPDDVEQFKRMLLTVYYPLIKDFFPEANGNWDGAIISALLSIGVFCDDRAIFDRGVEHFLRGRGNGGITKYIYPSGQSQETTRDQAHTQLGLGYFAQAAQIAWNQGVDLYGAADNRLALGYEYTARYLLGEEVPAYGVISERARGRLRDGIYEGVCQHYRYVKGLEMPYTARVLEQTRETSWAALVMYKGPAPKSPAATTTPVPSTQAPQPGALAGPTAQPPADALMVEPGGPIQDALDARVDSGGGWVVLAKGLHPLARALRVPSGVTLAGQGKETIIFLNPELTGPAIVNATDDLHDVTLRDFVVEAATTNETSSDPNQDRRRRAHQLARSRAGIRLLAQRPGQMRDLRLEHLTVRNSTHNGVVISGATNLVVAGCDFSDNGGSVVPGPGLQHNLRISRVIGCEVTDSRLDASPWGSGLDLSHSSNVVIENTEAARNALHGLRVTESQDVRIRGNLAEGNDGGGIVVDVLMDGSEEVEVRDNMSRNNGGYGIDVSGALGVTIQGNNLTENAHGDRMKTR